MKARILFCTAMTALSFWVMGCWELPLHIFVNGPEAKPEEKKEPAEERTGDPALSVYLSDKPYPQYVVAGSRGFVSTNYVLDAVASSEDISVSVFKARFTGLNNMADQLLNCQLWDGVIALTTGNNTVNPPSSLLSGEDIVFRLDNDLIVPAGRSKTITLRYDVKGRVDAEATSGVTTFSFGITDSPGSVVSRGVKSGREVTETIYWGRGTAMTLVASGSLSIKLDPGPPLRFVTAGSTDQVLAVLRVISLYEAVLLESINLQLDGTSATMALRKVTLWNGAKKIGEAVFTSRRYTTSTFTYTLGARPSDYTVPEDGQLLITVKGDIGSIGVIGEAFSGDWIAVNYDADSVGDGYNTGGLKGIGVVSGNAIYSGASEGDTNAAGVIIVRAVPGIERMPLANPRIVNVAGQTMYRFKISAPAGTNGISLYKSTFSVALSDFSQIKIDNFRLYYYTDAVFSIPAGSAVGTGGLLNSGSAPPNGLGASITNSGLGSINVGVLFNPTNPTSSTPEVIVVPAGETRYFELRADVSKLVPQSLVVVKLLGDSEFVSPVSARDVEERGLGNLIWSDNPFSTIANVNDPVWLSGFLIPNLPPSGLEPEILTAL